MVVRDVYHPVILRNRRTLTAIEGTSCSITCSNLSSHHQAHYYHGAEQGKHVMVWRTCVRRVVHCQYSMNKDNIQDYCAKIPLQPPDAVSSHHWQK